MTMAAVRRQSIDETLVTYIGSAMSILLGWSSRSSVFWR
jgi:hypothetical protein